MVESEYEKLLKRISDKISDGSTKNSTRFEIPPVDVVWEGQKTFLRNFSDFKTRSQWAQSISKTSRLYKALDRVHPRNNYGC